MKYRIAVNLGYWIKFKVLTPEKKPNTLPWLLIYTEEQMIETLKFKWTTGISKSHRSVNPSPCQPWGFSFRRIRKCTKIHSEKKTLQIGSGLGTEQNCTMHIRNQTQKLATFLSRVTNLNQLVPTSNNFFCNTRISRGKGFLAENFLVLKHCFLGVKITE